MLKFINIAVLTLIFGFSNAQVENVYNECVSRGACSGKNREDCYKCQLDLANQNQEYNSKNGLQLGQPGYVDPQFPVVLPPLPSGPLPSPVIPPATQESASSASSASASSSSAASGSNSRSTSTSSANTSTTSQSSARMITGSTLVAALGVIAFFLY